MVVLLLLSETKRKTILQSKAFPFNHLLNVSKKKNKRPWPLSHFICQKVKHASTGRRLPQYKVETLKFFQTFIVVLDCGIQKWFDWQCKCTWCDFVHRLLCEICSAYQQDNPNIKEQVPGPGHRAFLSKVHRIDWRYQDVVCRHHKFRHQAEIGANKAGKILMRWDSIISFFS